VSPRSVGIFLTSRSIGRSKLRAVPSSRSTSSSVRSLIEIRWRLGGSLGGRRSSRMTRMSANGFLLRSRDEQDAVDLVHLEKLHLDALLARGRKVLADIVGSDRQLAVTAVCEHGELHARGAAIIEELLDCGADRAARVEDVVNEDARHSFEREVERRRADDRLRVQRRLAAAHLNVVAIERDVELPERELDAAALFDQPPESLRERDTAPVDADEGDLVEVVVLLDDLVRDAGERPVDCLGVEEHLA